MNYAASADAANAVVAEIKVRCGCCWVGMKAQSLLQFAPRPNRTESLTSPQPFPSSLTRRARVASCCLEQALGSEAVAIKADMSKPEEVEALFKETAAAFKDPVNILVNNAGITKVRARVGLGWAGFPCLLCMDASACGGWIGWLDSTGKDPHVIRCRPGVLSHAHAHALTRTHTRARARASM